MKFMMRSPGLTHLFLSLLGCLVGCSDQVGNAPPNEAREPSPSDIYKPTLSFYHIPNCFLCIEMEGTLKELERDYGNAMIFRTVDYHLPGSQERLHKNKLGSHGIIISDAEGKSMWTLSGHSQDHEALVQAVERLAQR